jgi:hypothetical protein
LLSGCSKLNSSTSNGAAAAADGAALGWGLAARLLAGGVLSCGCAWAKASFIPGDRAAPLRPSTLRLLATAPPAAEKLAASPCFPPLDDAASRLPGCWCCDTAQGFQLTGQCARA